MYNPNPNPNVGHVCNTVTFESLDLESLFFCFAGYLQGIRVKFIYEGHRVKVKVTGAKKREISYFRNVKLRWAITAV